ncbi:MAG: prolipoprotein diacylglyceryl transferase [Bacteroidota bacterium]
MQDLLYINWSPDPQILGLPFRWYGLLFASSFFFGYLLMIRIFRKENIPDRWLESLTIYMAIGTVLGARFGHCFFYDPGYYLSHPLEILQVWKGGLASHGAAIGIILSLYLWSRRVSKRSILWILDRVVITVALSGLFIRTGNLMNSEILGEPADVPWAFSFPRDDQRGNPMQANWEGDRVRLDLSPETATFQRSFTIYRSYDQRKFTELPAPIILLPSAQQGNTNDLRVEKHAQISYLAENIGRLTQTEATGMDSTDARKAILIQHYDPTAAAFTGQWESERLRLRLEVIGLNPQRAYPTYLFRRYASDPPNQWTLIHRGELNSGLEKAVLDTVDIPKAGEVPTYRLALKSTSTDLIVRHPAQLYEAIAYSLVFVFMLWLYFRKEGKIPYGQFFGIFLVTVFGFRFVVEFVKEGFVDSLADSPINMGQILSIPFVLLGIFFLVNAARKGYVEPPAIPADQYEDPKKNKKKTSSKKS